MASDPVQALEQLLADGAIVPRLDPRRIARSSFYDAAYRTIVIAMVLGRCGEPGDMGLAFNHQKLRLFQFVAVHRSLLAPLQAWSAAFRSDRPISLFEWVGLPSGYATDPTYDQVLRYLVATSQFARHGERVIWLKHSTSTFVDRLVEAAEARELFLEERTTIDVLASTKVTQGMLSA